MLLHEDNQKLLTGPGPDDYLPIGLAVSYFFLLWTIGAMGQPVGMVRLMACRDTPTLRRSLFMIGIYYAPDLFAAGHHLCLRPRSVSDQEYLAQSDDIMPAMAVRLTSDWPMLGGLILAAPYAAAMSAVAGFLLLMSSSTWFATCISATSTRMSPNASVKWVSYATTAVVGVLVTLLSLRPPQFLQYLILFTGAGMGCTYLAPTVLGLYWRRATRAGALADWSAASARSSASTSWGWMAYREGRQDRPRCEGHSPRFTC